MAENDNKSLKIDITSTVVEKSIDLAKGFLNKLISPAIEEAGLLIKDQMTYWKFKNQVSILNKAKKQCEKQNISLKHISLKLLCPLLDNCALEEDEYLQDKWANLLVNLVDSEQNIENHVFPYILSQISKNEFVLVEEVYKKKMEENQQLEIELRDHLIEKPRELQRLTAMQDNLEAQLKNENAKLFNDRNYSLIYELKNAKRDLDQQLFKVNYKDKSIINKINTSIIAPNNLEEFEISNLIRLGLIKEIHESYANSQTLEIPNKPDESYFIVDLEVEVETDSNVIITELGVLFFKACNER